MNAKQLIRALVIVGLILTVGVALWGTAGEQRDLSGLLRNVNHAVWAGVGAERLFGGRH